MIQRIPLVVYFGLGLLFIAGGLLAIFSPTIGLPDVETSTDSGVILADWLIHSTMELGTAFVGIGAMLLWLAFHWKEAKWMNYVVFLFFSLLAGLHWFEFFLGNRDIFSPLFNSVPMVLVILVIIIRKRKDPPGEGLS